MGLCVPQLCAGAQEPGACPHHLPSAGGVERAVPSAWLAEASHLSSVSHLGKSQANMCSPWDTQDSGSVHTGRLGGRFATARWGRVRPSRPGAPRGLREGRGAEGCEQAGPKGRLLPVSCCAQEKTRRGAAPRDLRGSLPQACVPLSHPAPTPAGQQVLLTSSPQLPSSPTPHSRGLHQGVGQRLLGTGHAQVVLPGCARPGHTRVWARIWKAASQGASPGLGTRLRSLGVRVEPPPARPTWERPQLHGGCQGRALRGHAFAQYLQGTCPQAGPGSPKPPTQGPDGWTGRRESSSGPSKSFQGGGEPGWRYLLPPPPSPRPRAPHAQQGRVRPGPEGALAPLGRL